MDEHLATCEFACTFREVARALVEGKLSLEDQERAVLATDTIQSAPLEQASALVDAGAVPFLLAALERYPDHRTVVGFSLAALEHLGSVDGVGERVAAVPGLTSRMIALLRDHEGRAFAAQSALLVLGALGQREGVARRLLIEGVVDRAGALLEVTDTSLVEAALSALAGLCMGGGRAVRRAVAQHYLPGALALLERHERETNILMSVTRLCIVVVVDCSEACKVVVANTRDVLQAGGRHFDWHELLVRCYHAVRGALFQEHQNPKPVRKLLKLVVQAGAPDFLHQTMELLGRQGFPGPQAEAMACMAVALDATGIGAHLFTAVDFPNRIDVGLRSGKPDVVRPCSWALSVLLHQPQTLAGRNGELVATLLHSLERGEGEVDVLDRAASCVVTHVLEGGAADHKRQAAVVEAGAVRIFKNALPTLPGVKWRQAKVLCALAVLSVNRTDPLLAEGPNVERELIELISTSPGNPSVCVPAVQGLVALALATAELPPQVVEAVAGACSADPDCPALSEAAGSLAKQILARPGGRAMVISGGLLPVALRSLGTGSTTSEAVSIISEVLEDPGALDGVGRGDLGPLMRVVNGSDMGLASLAAQVVGGVLSRALE